MSVSCRLKPVPHIYNPNGTPRVDSSNGEPLIDRKNGVVLQAPNTRQNETQNQHWGEPAWKLDFREGPIAMALASNPYL